MSGKNRRKPPWDGISERRAQDDHDSIIGFGIMIGELSRSIKTLIDTQEKFETESKGKQEKLENELKALYRIFLIAVGFGTAIQWYLSYFKR